MNWKEPCPYYTTKLYFVLAENVLKKMMKIYGYLRVSTIDQDTEKNKAAILSFANSKGFLGRVEFVEEKVSGLKSWKKRKLKDLVESMSEGDILIVPELSRLGRSLVEVLEVLNELKDKGVKVFSVKENFQLNGDDIQSKVMRTMLGLFAEIERDLISARTKEGLAAAKASGKRLGRPKGPGKSKLDKFKPEIVALLKNGS
ncbi:MAG TPA: recombinase family protein, partial [bacterium]|nr:recombinase family protein [bacterium]